jgi:hypothetical protein
LQEAQTAVQGAALSSGIRESLLRLLAKLAGEVADRSVVKTKEN